MEFFDTVRQVKSNWTPYKKWELGQQKKEKQNEELRNQYPPTQQELEYAKQYGRTIVDVINTMDQHSIDKSEDASLIVKNAMLGVGLLGAAIGGGLGASVKYAPSIKKKLNLPVFVIGILGASIGVSLSGAIGEIWGAQIEKQASRIARFQTRKNDLKDSKHFVVYNEQQIKEAQDIAKTLPEVQEKKKDITIKKSFNPFKSIGMAKKTTAELAKDYKSYKNWEKEYLVEEKLKSEKFKNMNLSPAELSKAEKDKDNMLNVIKKIETSSLNYFMNMKLALCSFNILLDATVFGLGYGAYNIIDQLQKHKVLKQESVGINMAKMATLKVLPILVAVTAIGPTVKLMKDAARIGRFKAKQELLSNPQNFISYDSEQRKNIDNVEEPKPEQKGFIAKLKKDISDIKKFKQDYKEYHHYMDVTHKEELKLREALDQVKISDKQKADAVDLQKKAFHSFEKMDEKAQRYTDDTDAAVDVTKLLIMTVISSAAKVWSFSFYGKKSLEYNKGKELQFIDMYKLLKYFKNKDILTVVGISLIPTLINIPLIIKGIQIKKEAGKIGVMTAMKDLDDPKNFVKTENV